MNTSPQISTALQALGLSTKEQTIYLATLELGETLQLPLAKKIGMKRTSLRELLPDLVKRGFLQEQIKGKRTYLVATDPESLIGSLSDQVDRAKEALPELISLQNNLENKPRLFFYEGVEGVQQIYELTLATGKTVRSFVDISRISPEIEPWLTGQYTRQRTELGIKALNIVNETELLDTVMPSDKLRHNKVISKEEFPFDMEVLVFGEYVAYIHFRKEQDPSAVLIQSHSAARTMRSIHKALWRQK